MPESNSAAQSMQHWQTPDVEPDRSLKLVALCEGVLLERQKMQHWPYCEEPRQLRGLQVLAVHAQGSSDAPRLCTCVLPHLALLDNLHDLLLHRALQTIQ